MASTHQVKRHATSGEGMNILVARAIYFIVAVIVTLIVARMILLLAGIDYEEPVANIIYMVSTVFVVPFFIIFGYTPTYGAPVFEIGSTVAVLMYVLVGWGLAILVTLGSWHSDEV